MELIRQQWPWYISGPLISMVLLTLLLVGKRFGLSSNLRTMCSIAGAGRAISFFRFDWKSQRWNLIFAAGAVVGGFIGAQWLSTDAALQLSTATVADLSELGIEFDGKMAPSQLFSLESMNSGTGWLVMILGGFLVGFGARWAGGCTSGHAISGISNLQFPSLIATVGFFIGGLLTTHFLMPLIFYP